MPLRMRMQKKPGRFVQCCQCGQGVGIGCRCHMVCGDNGICHVCNQYIEMQEEAENDAAGSNWNDWKDWNKNTAALGADGKEETKQRRNKKITNTAKRGTKTMLGAKKDASARTTKTTDVLADAHSTSYIWDHAHAQRMM